MKIYHIKDDYINYLRKFDSKVLTNKNEKRPYVGVVMTVNEFNYYIPLSSPKDKHKKMKNAKDFHKIKGGEYGAINFNLMIPSKYENLIEYDVNSEEDEKYKRLVQQQYQEILNMKDIIKNKSNNIYNLYKSDESSLSSKDKQIKNRCCNFLLLEEKCKEYN